MKKLKFRRIVAKNFMCFGLEGIELIFDDYGHVVLINGLNLDTGTEVNPASNGAGKSSIQDIIAYGLYGKTVKKPKKLNHSTVINHLAKKKLEVEIEFDDLCIVRGREPDKLKVWKSQDHIWDESTDLTKGGTPRENQKIIDKAIGLSHTSFCNIIVFDDSNSYSFLELDAAGKRTVVENLLGLDRYRDYHQSAKDILKEIVTQVKELTATYERLQNEIDACDKRITKIVTQEQTWHIAKQQDLKDLQAATKKKQLELQNCDDAVVLAEYHDSQSQLEDLNQSITDLEGKEDKIITALKDAKVKLDEAKVGKESLTQQVTEVNINIHRLRSDLTKCIETVRSLESLEEGQHCMVCHGQINKQNYANALLHERNTIAGLQVRINKEGLLLQAEKAKLDKRVQFIAKLADHINDAENKLVLLNKRRHQEQKLVGELNKVQRPDTDTRSKLLEAEIVELKKQYKAKQEELRLDSPYKEILDAAGQEKAEKIKDCEAKAQELRLAEKERPYYEYWVEAFGDKGIRRYVVDGLMPALNARIAYWMQYLIDAKIELIFDNELNETITVCGSETEYHAMSNGEKRRINLAVSQAFAYVMMLNSGSCPSLVFLDEITGGGIDRAGIVGIYNMIFELAKERQVFITTHNDTLIDMLQGCASITLRKKNGITSLVSQV